MAVRPRRRYESPPLYWRDPAEHTRKIAYAVRDMMNGRSNAHYEVELVPDAIFTDFDSDIITEQTSAFLAPRSAEAAAALPFIWSEVLEPTVGTNRTLRIHHDSSPLARPFGLQLVS